MEVKFPVTLDNGVIIYGNEEPFEFENEQKFNGYDADGVSDKIKLIQGGLL